MCSTSRLLPAHGRLLGLIRDCIPHRPSRALFTGKCFAFTTFTAEGTIRCRSVCMVQWHKTLETTVFDLRMLSLQSLHRFWASPFALRSFRRLRICPWSTIFGYIHILDILPGHYRRCCSSEALSSLCSPRPSSGIDSANVIDSPISDLRISTIWFRGGSRFPRIRYT